MSASAQQTSAAAPKLFKCLPFPQGDYKDVFDLQAIRMVLLHNTMIRGFNSLLHYASHVSPTKNPKEFKAFLGYATLICAYVHHHHANEEEMYFPFLTSKLGATSMDHNVEGHETFKPPFKQFEDLLSHLQSTASPSYSAEDFRSRIYAFAEPLFEHLGEEIDTLRTPRMKVIAKADLDDFEKRMEAHIRSTTSLTTDPMMFWVNGDGVNGAWFPPLPAPIAFVCRTLLWHKHADMWAFGSCDKYMRVKPEFAAYEPELEGSVLAGGEKVPLASPEVRQPQTALIA